MGRAAASWADIIVVTSDYHYARSQYIFEKEYSDTDIRIHFSLCNTIESACEFDLKRQKAHEVEALKRLKEMTEK